MSKTIGIFGGAFDPVHIGHSKLVSDIKKIFDFEKILIIPSGKPVLKNSHFADSIKRIEMLNVAFKNTQDVFIDDRETAPLRHPPTDDPAPPGGPRSGAFGSAWAHLYWK
mgnify:CR=1 FL=1